MATLFEIGLGLGLGVWCLFLFFTHKAYRHLRPLERVREGVSFKRLSIIIATQNSEDFIEDTLKRLLNSDYPNLQIIVVNDRSQDQTEEIINRVAINNDAITAVHVRELPTGWLGKVNALNEGMKKAKGEFVLLMDGDVQIQGDELKRAVQAMEDRGLDHLTLMPKIPCSTVFLEQLVLTSQLLFTLSARPWLASREKPLKCAKGIGPFNMIRKSFYDQTEGLEWLKMDISDDVAVSHLIVKNGGLSHYARAGQGPVFPWYRDALHMMHGLEKNIYGGFCNYKLSLFFLVAGAASLPVLIPALCLGWASSLSLTYFFLFLLFNFIFALKVRGYIDYSLWRAFFLPLGIMQLNLVMVRATFLCHKNQGIFWGGTFYPLKKLRSGLRVRLGL